MIVDLQGPDGATVSTVGSPMLFDGAQRSRRYPPPLGADTEAILRELGYVRERIVQLRADRVVLT
jgi:crotonobetainyl-CoA:carnitine CoA-transferase CaiB-like acyl-CoA transferase